MRRMEMKGLARTAEEIQRLKKSSLDARNPRPVFDPHRGHAVASL